MYQSCWLRLSACRLRRSGSMLSTAVVVIVVAVAAATSAPSVRAAVASVLAARPPVADAVRTAAMITASPVATAQYAADYDTAYALGLQAYTYGEPLMDMQRVFQTTTSVTVADNHGNAPVNQWSHLTSLVDTSDSLVVSPNADTLYSTAWLALQYGPMIVHVPDTGGRLNVVPAMSPYEENFASIGNGFSGGLTPGDYMFAGPNYVGKTAPVGVTVIHSPYNRVWLVARTEVYNQADTANAVAIQASEKLVPLSKWTSEGLNYVPAAPKMVITTPTLATIPTGLAYWDELGSLLKQFPPPAADQPLLSQLATVGIGPGLYPSFEKQLSQGTLDGLAAAVAAGPSAVQQDLISLVQSGLTAHTGWAIAPTGNYATDYTLRAVVDRVGLGALPKNVAIYPFTQTDDLGNPLNGATTSYVAHFPASDFPVPVQGFWSLTMYAPNGQFVPNPLNRHVTNDRSTVHYNADGSLDLYLQNTQPSTPAQQDNWLPAPAGAFQLTMRLYGMTQTDIDPFLAGGAGSPWQPPTILPCLPNGYTQTGIACAS